MCRQRGSVIAEVVLKKVTRAGGDSDPRTPALLAQELVGMVNDRSSILCRKVLGSLAVNSAVIDGPIAERLCDLVASASDKALEQHADRDVKYNEMLNERMGAEDNLRDEIDRLQKELSSASDKALENTRKVDHLFDKIALRMRNKGMYKAWVSWDTNLKEGIRQKGLLEKMVFRMQNSRLLKAWSTWHFSVSQRKSDIVKEATKKYSTMSDSRVEIFHAKCALRMVRNGKNAFLKWKKRFMCTAWNVWCWRRYIRKIDKKFTRLWRRSLLGRVLDVWTSDALLDHNMGLC